MNERIREFMPKPWVWPYPDRELYTKEQLEKFAELIVRKCAHVGFNAAYPGQGVDVSAAIKRHFGVDEE